MDQKAYNFLNNIVEACKQFDGKPEVAFVRGKIGSGLKERSALIMLVGPRLTLESLVELKKDILDALDAKEDQLRGKDRPDTATFSY